MLNVVSPVSSSESARPYWWRCFFFLFARLLTDFGSIWVPDQSEGIAFDRSVMRSIKSKCESWERMCDPYVVSHLRILSFQAGTKKCQMIPWWDLRSYWIVWWPKANLVAKLEKDSTSIDFWCFLMYKHSVGVLLSHFLWGLVYVSFSGSIISDILIKWIGDVRPVVNISVLFSSLLIWPTVLKRHNDDTRGLSAQ